MKTRPINASDAVAVSRLTSQLGVSLNTNSTLANIHHILERDDHQAYVLEDEHGDVIAWVHVIIALRLGSLPFAEIAGIVIDQDHQNQGHGRNLMNSCKNWARSRGISEIRVRVNEKREQAKEFYVRRGFTHRKTQNVYYRDI
ncbi:GNAT family N-acetyltransferase [Alginatibacterium sediminis]|uniref:GNAT family N-acetyltransferase n=1 Tax=Alginatibacterium sediminis TaxID=2164068 RepID=A0A420E8W5_9ALTE|nr:GNAT family N-acetyltransferase [Alginatibacterium sediminis]RKF15821.1 GNAT family N-acetyltransferase [Alginatibacterium sediminis]